MANRSSLNDTEADQDDGERERKMREVQAMLREMRYRSCVGQKKLADKEKTEAGKCKFTRSDKQNTAGSIPAKHLTSFITLTLY